MNKKLLILVLLLFFVFSLGVLGERKDETSSEQKWNIRELDATQIKLVDIKLVHSYSKYPRWSPDGKKILYTHCFPDCFCHPSSEIWVVNPDGSNKEHIINGCAADWSPDGKRIAYKKSKSLRVRREMIAIFDLVEKKEYILYEKEYKGGEVGIVGHTRWTKDGKSLFFVRDEISVDTKIKFLNLEDLSWKDVSLKKMVYDGKIRNYKLVETEYQRIVTEVVNKNLSHPNFKIFTERPQWVDWPERAPFAKYIPSYPKHTSEDPKIIFGKYDCEGIWAINVRNYPFAMQLLDGRYVDFPAKLSPDLTKLLFLKERKRSWRDSGIPHDLYVAKVCKAPTSNVKYYEFPLGRRNGVKEKDILAVCEAKINPLNNKLVGYNKEKMKGTVLVESVSENKALVRTLWLYKDFGQNPVAVKSKNSFGYLKEIFFKEKTIEVKVIPKIIGTLKDGFYIEKKEVIPSTIAVKGPEIIIEDIENVKTSPIDVSSWTQSGEIEADIILQAPYLKFASLQTKAKVRITIAETDAIKLQLIDILDKAYLYILRTELEVTKNKKDALKYLLDAIKTLRSAMDIADDESKETIKDYERRLLTLKRTIRKEPEAAINELKEIEDEIRDLWLKLKFKDRRT